MPTPILQCSCLLSTCKKNLKTTTLYVLDMRKLPRCGLGVVIRSKITEKVGSHAKIIGRNWDPCPLPTLCVFLHCYTVYTVHQSSAILSIFEKVYMQDIRKGSKLNSYTCLEKNIFQYFAL